MACCMFQVGGLLHYFETLTLNGGRDSKELIKFLVDQFYGHMMQYVDDMSEW